MVRRLVTFAALGIGLMGCELANVAIPRSAAQLVVHAILDPTNRIQYVLVEQSLTGAVDVVGQGTYDPNNPIVTGNGVPVSGAVVKITGTDGVVLTGIQQIVNGQPSGVYRIQLGAYVINPGEQYTLTVAAQGKTVTGTTIVPIVPGSPIFPIPPDSVSFNRDHDSVHVHARGVSLARAYVVQIEAPVSSFSIFGVDSVSTIAGDARNLFTAHLLHLFYPGFLQRVTVAAVDTNVYDYYRSANDPFTGSGLINHLTGGLGVFGSAVTVSGQVLDVTQDPTGDPIEGTYTLRRGPPGITDAATDITLYLEAKGVDQPDGLSGSHHRGAPAAVVRGGVAGTRSGNAIMLELLFAQNTNDVNYIFNGITKGDSLIGSIGENPDGNGSFGRSVIYVKAGK